MWAWLESLVGTTADTGPITESTLPMLDYEDPDLTLPGTQAAGNWRRITQGKSDLTPLNQERMQELAFYLSDKNPLARGILDLIVSFIVGEGFAATSKDDDIQAAIDRFWDDGQNDLPSRVEDMTRELSIYGEQVALAFVNQKSGRVALVSVDPRQIRAVIPHPHATDRAYAVGLAASTEATSVYRWVKIIAEDSDPSSDTFGKLIGAQDGETVTRGDQAIPFFQPSEAERVDDATTLVGCFFWAINKPRSAMRGRSDLLAVADFVDLYDRLMFDESERMSFLRTFIWDVKVTGANESDITKKANASTAPRPGAVRYHNESEEWTAVAPDLNTQDSQNVADLILSLIATAVGIPKAQPLDCKVLTPDGWRVMGDLDVGDDVITPAGRPSRILGIYPQGERPIFQVRCSDGATTRATAEHLWLTRTAEDRNQHRPGSIKTTEQVAVSLRHGASWNQYLPLVDPLPGLPGDGLPINPYLLGLLLGDGHIRAGRRGAGVEILLSSADTEIIASANELLPVGAPCPARRCQADPSRATTPTVGEFQPIGRGTVDYRYVCPHRNAPLKTALISLGLVGTHAHTKFVPSCYLTADPASRLAILQGLLDTDGSPSSRTSARFITVSRQLADDVRDLTWSLGGVCNLVTEQTAYTYKDVKKQGRPSYALRITLPEGVEYFRLARKQAKILPGQKTGRAVRTIRAIEPLGAVETQCILLDDPAHLYVTDDYIVTHNTWVNGIMDVNRAASQSMDAPALKRMSRRQRYVRRMLERMVRFALDQAEIAGTLKSADDGRHEFTLSTPEMSSRDLEVAGRSLMSTTQAMGMASAAGWIDDQTAQDAVGLMMTQLGVDVDMAEVRDRLEKQAQDQADTTDEQRIPDYFNLGAAPGPDNLARAVGHHGSNGASNSHVNGTGGDGTATVAVVSPAAKDMAAVFASVSKSLTDLGTAGVIDTTTAQMLVVKILGAFGIEVTPEDIAGRLDQEAADRAVSDGGVPGGQPPAAGGGGETPPAATTLPDVSELINLDQMALEAIREMGAEHLGSIGWPVALIDEDTSIEHGLNLYAEHFTEVFTPDLHPRGAGGKFASKPDTGQDAQGAVSPPAGNDEIKAQIADLTAQLKARDASKPKEPRKPPAHPAMRASDVKDAIASVQEGDDVTVTMTNGLEVTGKATIVQGGNAVIQTADGKFAILHGGLKQLASVKTPRGEMGATPAPARAASGTTAKAPADRSAAAKKAAQTRAANRAAATAKA